MEILQKIGEEYEGEELLEFLKSNADYITEDSYVRKYSAEELEQQNQSFLHKSVELAKIEKEKKRVIGEFVTKMKGLKSETNQLMNNLMQEGELVDGELFNFKYEELKMVGVYDSQGLLINSRPMTAKERQGYLFGGGHIKAMTGTEG